MAIPISFGAMSRDIVYFYSLSTDYSQSVTEERCSITMNNVDNFSHSVKD